MIHPLKLTGRQKGVLKTWVFSDRHNNTTPGELSSAVTQIDQEQWDLGFNLGDNMRPDDDGDTDYQTYLAELNNFSNHSLSDIFHIPGNHDRTKQSDPSGADFYHKKYCSPFATDNAIYATANRKYNPDGKYNAYTVKIGNLVFICLGDNNSGAPPGGEDGLGSGAMNFRASGNISRSDWNWFKRYSSSEQKQ